MGSFLRCFRFGHVRQLDAVASQTLGRLAERVPGLLPAGEVVWLDVDDTIKPVYGRSKLLPVRFLKVSLDSHHLRESRILPEKSGCSLRAVTGP